LPPVLLVLLAHAAIPNVKANAIVINFKFPFLVILLRLSHGGFDFLRLHHQYPFQASCQF
jgi:hypothetical protein